MNDEQIAHNIGISVSTYYAWQNSYPEFSEAIKKGKAPVDEEVENALLKSALGYDYEETVTEVIELPDGKQRKHIRKIKRHIPPSNLAQFFWLKNRKPEKWRDKPDVVENSAALDKLDQMIDEVRRVAFNS